MRNTGNSKTVKYTIAAAGCIIVVLYFSMGRTPQQLGTPTTDNSQNRVKDVSTKVSDPNKDSVVISTGKSDGPLCTSRKEPEWVKTFQSASKKHSRTMQKDTPVYDKLKEDWSKYLSGSPAKCRAVPLDPTKENGQFFQQLYDYYSSHSAFCPRKVRLGGEGDGGKWLCDILPCDRCVVYSLGSGHIFTFEEAIIRQYGCEIHTFDCTTPGVVGPKGVHFHEWCLGEDGMKSGKQFYSLTTIMKMLNHTSLTVLKMDIERYEYMVVENLLSLKPSQLPKQMAFETHLNPMNGFDDYVTFEKYEEFWNRLQVMGYRVIAHDVNPIGQCCCDFTILRDED